MTSSKVIKKASKHIYLVRHAQALPAQAEGDINRPLSPKGKDDALALGKVMLNNNYKPEIALCSPAKRTGQTLDLINESLKIEEIKQPQTLYSASAGDLLSELQKIDNEYDNIMIVAHNPGISQLASLLVGSGRASHIQRLKEGHRPGRMVLIAYEGENWSDIQPHENEIIDIMDPLDYNAPSRPTRWT